MHASEKAFDALLHAAPASVRRVHAASSRRNKDTPARSCTLFKGYVEQLAHEKGRDKELALYNKIEHMAPQLIAEERKIFKGEWELTKAMCAG